MTLEKLISSINIVEFISQYTELSQKGDEWWGLSCFKKEKTPSFSVRENPPLFYDYSSGFGGNVYTFVKRFYNCTPTEAVEILKQYAGIKGNIGASHNRMSVSEICRKYKKKITPDKPCTAMILPDNFMERYEKDGDKLNIWEREGISKETLDKFQIRYDRISDRLVYPIRNIKGEIVNIGGRAVNAKWKEKGQKKYCYFYSWGSIDTLYGLSDNIENIKKKREIILFEGCKSVLIADTWGVYNTSALLTSHLNRNQMKMLAKLGCRVIFALDKDVDISDDKNIAILKRYVNVEYIMDTKGLLSAKDSPVDKGEDVFIELYRTRKKLK